MVERSSLSESPLLAPHRLLSRVLVIVELTFAASHDKGEAAETGREAKVTVKISLAYSLLSTPVEPMKETGMVSLRTVRFSNETFHGERVCLVQIPCLVNEVGGLFLS